MFNKLDKARKYAESYRFNLDLVRNLSTPVSYKLDIVENELVRNSLEINQKVFPELNQCLTEVCSNLGINRDIVTAFVSSSSEIQAYCYSTNKDECIINFSSEIIKLLSFEELKFVIGHEIGHFLLGHGLVHRNENEINVFNKKYQEISADRIGVLCAGDINYVYKTLIKLATGLGEDYIRFDISEYLSQLENINLSLGENPRNTHPSILVRIKAIDLFYRDFSKFNEKKKNEIDLKVSSFLNKYLDGPINARKKQLKENYEIWTTIKEMLKDKKLDQEEQKIIKKKFGNEVYEKILTLLKDYNSEEVAEFISQKIDETKREIENYQIIPSK